MASLEYKVVITAKSFTDAVAIALTHGKERKVYIERDNKPVLLVNENICCPDCNSSHLIRVIGPGRTVACRGECENRIIEI